MVRITSARITMDVLASIGRQEIIMLYPKPISVFVNESRVEVKFYIIVS